MGADATPDRPNGLTSKEILLRVWGKVEEIDGKLDGHLVHAAGQDQKLDALETTHTRDLKRVDKQFERQWAFIIGLPALALAVIGVLRWQFGS